MNIQEVSLDDVRHPPCNPPDSVVESLKSVGLLKPVNLIQEGDKYYASDDSAIVAAAKILKWKTIRAHIRLTSDGYAEELFLIRLRGALSKIDLGPGPVGKALRQLCQEYIQQFGKTEQDFTDMSSAVLGLPVKVLHQALNEPEDRGINLTEFYAMLDEIRKTPGGKIKSGGAGSLHICPHCGWESEKSDIPKELMPAVIKEIVCKRMRHLLKGMSRRDQRTTVSLIHNDLKELASELRS